MRITRVARKHVVGMTHLSWCVNAPTAAWGDILPGMPRHATFATFKRVQSHTPKWQVSCSNSFAISQAPKHTMASMKLQQGARAAAMKQQQGSVAVRVNSRGPVVRGVQQASLVAAAASMQSASFSSRTAQRVVRSRCVFRVRF